jgi:hypothetical protein
LGFRLLSFLPVLSLQINHLQVVAAFEILLGCVFLVNHFTSQV